jgi:Arc/MetJ family transcription regulator
MDDGGLMRTTINVEDEILSDLMRFTNAKTRTEAVNHAIAEWVRRQRILHFRSKRGKIQWEGDLDEMRSLELKESEQTHG